MIADSDPILLRPLGSGPATTERGHEERFPPPNLSARFACGKETSVNAEQLRQMLFDSGFTQAKLVAVNPFWNIHRQTLPGVLDMTNFGAGDVEYGFNHLAELGQRGPQMAGEYWAGWFDVWGEPHHTQILEKVMADLRWMLDRSYSFNLYMVHGGTTFGWMGGARMEDGNYMPDVNTYDYDAPLNERGDITPKTGPFVTC